MEFSRKFRFRFSVLLFLTWCHCYCVLVVSAARDIDIELVDLPTGGKIQGVKKTDGTTGLSYVYFQGIPYAKAPVGDLRFAKPQPHPNIAGTFDATKDDRIICPHFDQMTVNENKNDFTEDCLILNVYLKKIISRTDPLKKVLVYIHGGGFRALSGRFQDPKSFVITQDVIVVTINYRLGILGFLSTENDASPGNYGLWDQTLAIKWVKDNIRAFGGDPDDIAIAGESAGGVSVGYQSITPRAKGLFSRAYTQSGTATSSFALSMNAQTDALSVAKSTGCWTKPIDDINTIKINVEDSKAVIACLRNVPLSAITAFYDYSLTGIQFAPRVDGDFISDTPAKLMQDDGYLDSIGFFERTYLTGITNNEAQISYGYLQLFDMVVAMNHGMSEEEKDKTVKGYRSLTEKVHITSRLGEPAASNKNISDEIKSFYKRRFVNERSFIETTTDVSFLIPSLDLVRTASRRETCNAYLFVFDYFPLFMKGSVSGTPHSADLLFWFDLEISTLESILQVGMQGPMDDEDMEMKRLFSSLIGEFVRSGNPGTALKNFLSCGWPRYDVSDGHFLNLNTNPWIGSFLEKEKQDLWFKTVPRMTGTSDNNMAGDGKEESECGTITNGAPVFASPHCNLLMVIVTVLFCLF